MATLAMYSSHQTADNCIPAKRLIGYVKHTPKIDESICQKSSIKRQYRHGELDEVTKSENWVQRKFILTFF